jgi:hypothetical protein
MFALLALMTISTFSYGQAISQNGGSIQGTITDPSGALVSGATVVIADPATGYTHTLKTDKAGFYSLGPLIPGTYTISISAPRFEAVKVTTVVRVGTVTSGNEKLTLGKATETVEVDAGALQVNTDQIGVSGIVTKEQIDSLPINGRNILDIAQIQPGVILESGESFDPTKAGYSAISVGGVSARSTRILFDGQDITDETVGTTLYNVPSGPIDEFQLNRSTQDVSGEVTSTGQVLLASSSGTNAIHGSVFYNFQDHSVGFAHIAGIDQPFQRNQFGGYVGGPIIKDKLFFFGGGERILQHEEDVAEGNSAFSAIYKAYPFVPAPFTDDFSILRLDYNAPHGIHAFARAVYSVNSDVSTFGYAPYSIYENRDNTPGIVGGVDLTTGKFTHSIRVGYEKFHNILEDATAAAGTSIYNPYPIGGPNGAISFYDGAEGFFAGPNLLAPQQTFQSDKQLRYDGTWTKGANNVKFGAEMNRILGAGYAPFYGESSLVGFGTGYGTCLNNACSNPVTDFGAAFIDIGNGNGFFSERPGFGYPGGATPSWRFAAYLADTWKISPAVTITAGLRWSVDTDRANQDLPTPLCSSVDASLQFTGCTGNTPLFNQYGSATGQGTLGYQTRQPYANFGPQLGFVVSPGAHKYSVRGGIGIYYENDIFNNTGNTRTESIQKAGQYQNQASPCSDYYPGAPTLDNSTTFSSINFGNVCGGASIGSIAGNLNTIRTAYQGITKGVASANPDYIGSAGGDNLKALAIYAGPYKTPYAIQFNGGLQEEVTKGLILSVDYVHNSTLKVPITIDVNHQGAARNLNVAAAKADVAAVTSSVGCAGGSSPAAINCAIAVLGPQSLPYWGYFGLTSVNDGYGYSGAPGNQPGGLAYLFGSSQKTAAFQGDNNHVGVGNFVLPIGRSGYDALQVVLQQQKAHPVPGVMSSNFQISYSLSRIVSDASGNSDQFFAGQHPLDNDDPNLYIGRNELDHSNMISFAGSAVFKYGLQLGFAGHFFSAPPSTLALDASTYQGNGEILRTDLDGDGSTGDILPGTVVGAYMHQVKGASLAKVISNYNATHAGQLTPAGTALVTAGIFTPAQLTAIDAVQPTIATAPNGPIPNPAFRTFDLSASYPIGYLKRFHSGLLITPGVTMYNVTNMSNYGGYNSTLLNTETVGGPVNTNSGYLTGPNDQADYNGYHVNRGSGTFDSGAPRTTEFQLKIAF